MRITFTDAIHTSAQEVAMLRARAEDPAAFDAAMQNMIAEGWSCDTAKGSTRNRAGVQSHFVGYDWGAEYDAAPHHVFYDFFRGHLLNKYSRAVRGLGF